MKGDAQQKRDAKARDELVQRLIEDPKFLTTWAREQVVLATVILAEAMVSTGGRNTTSQRVQAVKELMANIEMCLEEARGDEPSSKGKSTLAPTKASSTTGARDVWRGGHAVGMADEHPAKVGEPSVELPDRPE